MYCACNTAHCCSAIDFLLLNHALNSPELSALITTFRESYSSMSMSRESQRLKSSRSCMWLNSRNALVQHLSENAIFVFPVLPGSAEAQVIWAGTVKCLLIACLSVTFLPKISKSVHVYESYSKPKVFRRGVIYADIFYRVLPIKASIHPEHSSGVFGGGGICLFPPPFAGEYKN